MSFIQNPYLQLIRFDKPIGTLLLLWPTFWALLMAGNGSISLKYTIIFSVGTFLMRSAGCILNDIADRNFDGYVERTRKRPLASRKISLKKATLFLALLLSLAASLLLFLNSFCLYLALVALALTGIYPLCKRFFAYPQLVLSLTFSFGVLMAYAATLNYLPTSAFVLYALTAIWIFLFDTAYALSDINDDKKLGLFSSAISLGQNCKKTIYALMIIMQTLWVYIAVILDFNPVFYTGLIITSALFLYQRNLIENNQPFRAFLNNQWVGLVMFICLYLGMLFK